MMDLRESVLQTLCQYNLISPHSLVLVGVSGGSDSVTLLHVLNAIRTQIPFEIQVATLNHGLRGNAGAYDTAFVDRIARHLQLPVTVGKVDVPALMAELGMGVETVARRARYDFLAETARKVGAETVAVAHHMDDQAETVLMHILRGAGTHGLAGMALKSHVPYHHDLTLIRPLLYVSRAEIEGYMAAEGLGSRHDASNDDTTLLRNRLRHEVLPMLETVNPQIRRSLSQLAGIASADDDFVDQQLHKELVQFAQVGDRRITLRRQVFANAHLALQVRYVRWACERLGNVVDTPTYVHSSAAWRVALYGQVGALALLPNGMRLRVDYDTLVIERDDAPALSVAGLAFPEGLDELTVSVPGVTVVGEGMLHALATKPERFQAQLNIPPGSRVSLRRRLPKDRFRPLGMEGHRQTLKDWMIDHKVPRSLRYQVPLLIVNGEIAALVYGNAWPVSETFAVHDDSEHVVYWYSEKGLHDEREGT